MRRRFASWSRGFAIALVLALGLFGTTFMAAPLPVPAPLAAALPPASPPPEMALFHLSTGVIHRNAAFAYRGGSFFDQRDFAASALLVRHPAGDLLIDTGFGRGIDAQFEILPAPFRALTRYTRRRSAAELLARSGYDRKRLRAILLTHAHWDHVSGVADFPGTPVLVTRAERDFIRRGGVSAAVARSLQAVRYQEYSFPGEAYLGFPRSYDVHGDGSVVVVPAPGHTPGSVIVFLASPGGERYALVGDLVWQLEGILEREERPWLQRLMVDGDRRAVQENLLRMAAIHARFPALIIVPAHDQRAFARMASLK